MLHVGESAMFGPARSPNYKDRQRNRARRYWFEYLYAAHNSLCHWCKSATVMIRYFPESNVVRVGNGLVVWREDGLMFEARFATIDHVVSLAEGGGNGPPNLVLACSLCNNKRNNDGQEPTNPLRIMCVCPDCLSHKPKKAKRCKACYVARAREWLTGQGWLEAATYDEGHSKFIDPQTGEHHVLTRACRVEGMRKRGPDL